MKNVSLICTSFRFSKIEFGKPTFKLMEALQKNYHVESNIIFDDVLYPLYYNDNDQNLKTQIYNNVNLSNISQVNIRRTKDAYRKYIKNNAKKIDVLVFFHGNRLTNELVKLYKRINCNGCVAIILDYSIPQDFTNVSLLKNIYRSVRYHYLKELYKMCDMFFASTGDVMRYLSYNKWHNVNIAEKLQFLPYGCCYKYCGVNVEKENIFLTVGRIGTYEKNSQLILNALKEIDLKDWKFVFIGPVANDFKQQIDKFFIDNPEKKKNVSFVGSIDDKEMLSQYYTRAKVFILSSKYESFGLVLVEALMFNNFILSTSVGCANDIIKSGYNGYIYNDSSELSKYIKYIIDGRIDYDILKSTNSEIAHKYNWDNIVKESDFFKKTLSE